MSIHQANREYKKGLIWLVPLSLFLLIIFGYVLTEIVGYLWFKPWLLSVGVFYWTLYKPSFLPVFFILCLGLLEDGIAGTPFGLYGLGVLLMHYMTFHQRQSLVYSPFLMVFIGFVINLFIVNLVMTSIMWVIGLQNFIGAVASWLTTFLLFPLIFACFSFIKQRMMKD